MTPVWRQAQGMMTMSRKRKKAKVTLAGNTGPVEIDNPFYAPGSPRHVPRRIHAVRSLRDDPLARLHDRRQISDSEFRAGRDFQKLLEHAELGRMRTPRDQAPAGPQAPPGNRSAAAWGSGTGSTTVRYALSGNSPASGRSSAR